MQTDKKINKIFYFNYILQAFEIKIPYLEYHFQKKQDNT